MIPEIGYFIGVDVGTQSVRAGLVTTDGTVRKTSSRPIKTWNPYPDVYEQSSDDIWRLCIDTIKEITTGIDAKLILGIGFDATCSLVAVDKEGKSLSLSRTGNSNQNIILWMDHRAIEEANFINSKNHSVLKYVGGKISPEMEPPKLLWIKKNLPNQWESAGNFFDLPDYLTYKATNSFQRSLCSLVCKWTYVAGSGDVNGWQDDFWRNIGLQDLLAEKYVKIGTEVLAPGTKCGKGLSEQSAKEMNLLPGTPVSISIIDAHAGGLGVLACTTPGNNVPNLEERLALICGTSTCHMKISKHKIFTPGVWGPYFSAMVPDQWCSEAGQSAAGALLDHIINSHPSTALLRKHMSDTKEQRHITDVLNEMADELKARKNLSSVSFITSDYHVYPDYHGNRSPLANPNLNGMVCGLTLAENNDDLIKSYVATVQALAYSTKHIISALQEQGHTIKTLLVCGGLSKNPLYIQMHADITGLPVLIPNTPEPVLVGSAILGASAARYYPSVNAAMSAMSGQGVLVNPNEQDFEYHSKKFKVFLTLLKCQEEINGIMVEN